MNYKTVFTSLVGITGSLIAFCFGGWNVALNTLVMFMIIDYVFGLIVAGIFKRSKKTKSGRLSSSVGWRGLAKKFATLVFVAIGYRLDLLTGNHFIKDAVCMSFIANEAISIIENAGIMGVPIPKVITKAIELLRKDEDNAQ